MKYTIYIFLFIFQLTISNLSAAGLPIALVNEISHTYLEECINKAIATRRLSEVDRLSNERGTECENELAHQIALYASDYTTGDTHVTSIKNFIESNFGVTPSNLYCVAPERIDSREFVFIDKENGIVIKVFPQIPNHYFKIIHELSGHEAFEALHIPQVNIPNFLALGKYTLYETDYLLLGMTLAEGKEIKKYFKEIYFARNPSEKQAAIDQVKHILRKLGEVLGEVHLKAAVKTTPSEEHEQAVIEHYTQAINKAIYKYEILGEKNSQALMDYFDQLLDHYELQSVYFSVFHGDAHLANFLYDQQSDRMTIIDCVRAHLSIDPHGFPISDNYVHDCVKIEESIAKQILSYESNEQLIQELKEAFHQGYDEKAAAIINSCSLALDRSYEYLSRLVSSLKWKYELNPSLRKVQRRAYDYYKKVLLSEKLSYNATP